MCRREALDNIPRPDTDLRVFTILSPFPRGRDRSKADRSAPSAPEVLEPIRCQLGVTHRVLKRLAPWSQVFAKTY
jgi:hypothetical protein